MEDLVLEYYLLEETKAGKEGKILREIHTSKEIKNRGMIEVHPGFHYLGKERKFSHGAI